MFVRAFKEFAEAEIRGDTVGGWAKSELFDIRHLGIGKRAPKTRGKDQEGADLKLSDYRGKVILLYFWSEF